MTTINAIIEWLGGIADAIAGFFAFVGSLVGDLVYMVRLTAKIVGQIPSYFSWLPAPVLALLGTVFALVVLYKIFGRD